MRAEIGELHEPYGAISCFTTELFDESTENAAANMDNAMVKCFIGMH
jgi:hypothetical protein